MTNKVKRPARLNGERGLLCAVMAQAVNDYQSGEPERRVDAALYFCGPLYQDHLDWLGLPSDFEPDLQGGGDG